jgi:hypothetical protein
MPNTLRNFPYFSGMNASEASIGNGVNMTKWAILSVGMPNQSNGMEGISSGLEKHR